MIFIPIIGYHIHSLFHRIFEKKLCKAKVLKVKNAI